MSGKFVDKMKKFMGFDEDEYEYEYEDEYEDDVEEAHIDKNVAESSIENIYSTSKINQTMTKGGVNKVVNIHSNSGAPSQMKVIIYEPTTYEEAPEIVRNVRDRKAVIINLENIANTELAKTIFDFLSGAVYALDGTMNKISNGIFVIAPSNIDIDGNVKKEFENKTLFPWQK